jgi:hypothetical protein
MTEITRSADWTPVSSGPSPTRALDLYLEGKLFARILETAEEIGESKAPPIYLVELLLGRIWEECDEHFADIDVAATFAGVMWNTMHSASCACR